MKKYRILPLLLIVCLLLTAAFPAAAAKNTADNSADTPQSTANVSSDGVPQTSVTLTVITLFSGALTM